MLSGFETRVKHAFDDVTSIIHQSLPSGDGAQRAEKVGNASERAQERRLESLVPAQRV